MGYTGVAVTTGVLQGSIQMSVLFNVFVNDLDAELEEVLIKFGDDTPTM